MRGLEVWTSAQGQRFQIVEPGMDGLIIQLTLNVEVVWDGFKTDELPQACERLHFGEFCGENVVLELEHLELDFEQVTFAHVAGFVACLADVDSLLEAVEILLREIDSGLGEQHGNELLGEVESQLALIIDDRGTSSFCDIPGGLQPMLALLADLEGVAEAEVELRLIVDVITAEFARLEDGEELRIPGQSRVGSEIGGGLERLILQDRRAGGLQGVIVLERQADSFLDGDSRGGKLREGRLRRRCV